MGNFAPAGQCGPALEVGDVGLDVGQDRDALVQVSDLWFMEVVITEDKVSAEFFGAHHRAAPGGEVRGIAAVR